MKIEYIKKDVTTVGHGIVAHGTNCSMGFGSGVAGAIRKKWPQVYGHFMTVPGRDKLGQADFVNLDPMCDCLWVANVYSQQNFGGDGKRYASPDAIETGMKAVMEHAAKYNLPVYMPKIGCGLGGLDWEADVEPIINRLAEQYPKVQINVCEWP
jgi:O-acetyl-ADP-ribose deacetylase (regulator of RNase III)